MKTAYGKQLDEKGSYVNYYVANTVVLVPNYGDPNDAVANTIIQKQYPGRKVVGIDVRNLYENGEDGTLCYPAAACRKTFEIRK